jgi:hypothetical protein
VALAEEDFAWIPFALAASLVLIGPLLNKLWIPNYELYYSRNYHSPNPTLGQIRAGAEWAVDVAAVVPNGALTLIGILLLHLSINPILLGAVCFSVLVLLFGVALWFASKRDLTERRRNLRSIYSPVALTQLFLAIGGLVFWAVFRGP